MDFMGIGPLELLLVLILGFLFFGPEKLPEIAAKVGKFYRNFSRSANNFTRTINEELIKETEAIKKDKDLKSISEDLKNTANGLIDKPKSKDQINN